MIWGLFSNIFIFLKELQTYKHKCYDSYITNYELFARIDAHI